MPSTVVISGPSCSSAAQLMASMVQLSDGTPSTSTVHAPHDESSHPRFDPVRSISWRKTSSSSSLGSMASSCLRPFTRSSMSSFFIVSEVPNAPVLRVRDPYLHTTSVPFQLIPPSSKRIGFPHSQGTCVRDFTKTQYPQSVFIAYAC